VFIINRNNFRLMALCACNIEAIKDTSVLHLVAHRFPDAKVSLLDDEDIAVIEFHYPGIEHNKYVIMRTISYMAVNRFGIAIERFAILVDTERLTDDIVRTFIDYKNNINDENSTV